MLGNFREYIVFCCCLHFLLYVGVLFNPGTELKFNENNHYHCYFDFIGKVSRGHALVFLVMDMDKKTALESDPLLGRNNAKEQKSSDDAKLRVQPKRKIIVEPLLLLYSLAGVPLMTLRSQYMYQKIALDMGINLNNLSSKLLYKKFPIQMFSISIPLKYTTPTT